MTVSAIYSPVCCTGDGTTVSFSFPYQFFTTSDLVVTVFYTATNQPVSPAPKLGGTGAYDYVVSGTVDSASGEYLSGATITFNRAPPASVQITIARAVPAIQPVSPGPNNSLPANSVVSALDRLAMSVQQVAFATGIAISTPLNDPPGAAMVLPPAAMRANMYFGFDGAGAPAMYALEASPVKATGGTRSATLAQRFGRFLNVIDDFGAAGSGVSDDSAAFAAALAAGSSVMAPAASYGIGSGFALPLNKQIQMQPGASFTGSGAVVKGGALVQWGYNPGGQASWAAAVSSSYEALSVDLGGYGPRSFGGTGSPTAINGSINIPAGTASTIYNGFGLSGYARNASTKTNGVGVFAQGEAVATGAGVWGLNSVTQDNGHAATVFGYECDVNVTNVNTAVYGIDITGGSSVEPAASVGLIINPLGTFASPPKRWAYAMQVADGASSNGVLIGAAARGTNSGSQPLQGNFVNASNQSVGAWTIISDPWGNVSMVGLNSGSLLVLGSDLGGIAQNQITMAGSSLGFFGAAPAPKQTVSGSRGSAAGVVLGSLLNALAAMGLVANNTTA